MSDSPEESPTSKEDKKEDEPEKQKSSACVLNLFKEAWNEILLENPEASAGHVEIVKKDGERKELTALQFWEQIIEDVETQKKDPDYLFTPEVEEVIAANFTTAIEPRVDERDHPIRLGDKYYIRRSTQPYLRNLNVGVDQWFLVQDFPPKPTIIKILRRKVNDKQEDDDKLLLEKLIQALETSPSKGYEQKDPMNLGTNPIILEPVLESSPDSVSTESLSTATERPSVTAGGDEPYPRGNELVIPSTSGFQHRSRSRTRRFHHGYRGRVRYFSGPRPPYLLQHFPAGPPPAHIPVARFAFMPSNNPLPAHRALPYAGNALIPANVYWRFEASRFTGLPVQNPYIAMHIHPSFYPRMPSQPSVVRPPCPTQNPWVPQAVRQDHGVPFYPGENFQPAHLQIPNLPRQTNQNQYPAVNNTVAHQSTVVYSETYVYNKHRTNQVSSALLTSSNNSSDRSLDLNSETTQFRRAQNNFSVTDRLNLDLTDIGDQTLVSNRNSVEEQTNMINDSRNEWVRSNLFTLSVAKGPTRCPSDLPPWSLNSGNEDRLLVVTLSPSVPPVQTIWCAQSPISSVFPLSSPQTTASSATPITTSQSTESTSEIKQICEKIENVKIIELESESIINESTESTTLVKESIVTTNTTTKIQVNEKSTTITEKMDKKTEYPQQSTSTGKSNKNKQSAKKTVSEPVVASEQKKTGAVRKITVEFLSSALAQVSKSSKKKKGSKQVEDHPEPKPSTSQGISVEFYSSGQPYNKPKQQTKPATTSKPVTTSKPATIFKSVTTSKPATSSKPATTSKPAFTDKMANTSKPETTTKAETTKEKTSTEKIDEEKVVDKPVKQEVLKPAVDEREYLVTPTIFEILESRKNLDPTELEKPPTNYMEDVIQRKERRWKLMDTLPGCPRLNIILNMIKKDNEMIAEEERLAKEKQEHPTPSTSKEPDNSASVTDLLIDSTEDPFEVLRLLADESRQKTEEEPPKQEESSSQENLPPNTRICDNIKVELDEEELGLLDNLITSPITFNPDVWVSDSAVLELKDQLFDDWWTESPEKKVDPAKKKVDKSEKKADPTENKADKGPSTSQTSETTKKTRKKKKSKKSSPEQTTAIYSSHDEASTLYSSRDEATQTDEDITEEQTEVETKDVSNQIEIKPAAPSYADMLKKKQQ